MDSIAYALRSEYDGEVEIDGEKVPRFQGGVLFVGDGDFHVRDELEAGKGAIVVPVSDAVLIETLNAYPALKQVAVPKGARPISPYKRRQHAALRHDAQLRGIEGAGSASKAQLVRALEAHDRAQLESIEAAQAVLAGDEDAIADAIAEDPPADVATSTGDTSSETETTKEA